MIMVIARAGKSAARNRTSVFCITTVESMTCSYVEFACVESKSNVYLRIQCAQEISYVHPCIQILSQFAFARILARNVIFGETLSTRRRFLYACTVFGFFAG